MSDIVISGYYGLGNSGDEALLKTIVNDLKKNCPTLSITALSGNKKHTHKMYQIKTVNRYNVFSVINELRKAKLLISGGGTLIQDATSTKSLLYYLSIISVAKMLGLKVMLYANGMGPIKDKNVDKVSKVLNKVDVITLREDDSLKEIKRCNITKPQIYVTADPAFNLTACSKDRVRKIREEFSIPFDKKIIAFSVREWKNNNADFEKQMAKVIEEIKKLGYYPVLMPMQMKKDLAISLDIKNMVKGDVSVIDRNLLVEEMLGLIGECDTVCGMRLHMLIFASVMNVPMAGIAYDPKIKGFMNYMNQKNYIDIKDFCADRFIEMIVKCLEQTQKCKDELKRTSLILKEKAMENAKIAVKLLNQNSSI